MGGWGDWMEADGEIQAIVAALQDEIEERVYFDINKAVAREYRQQVVAGWNYRIKLDVDGQAIQIVVFKNLQGDLELVSVGGDPSTYRIDQTKT